MKYRRSTCSPSGPTASPLDRLRGEGQHQDAGGKIIHAAPKTTSSIFSKSISKDKGRTSYRGLLEIAKGASESKSKVVCDALLLD